MPTGIGNEAMTNGFAVQLVPIAALEMGFTPTKARTSASSPFLLEPRSAAATGEPGTRSRG
jgi:hypothetical protein